MTTRSATILATTIQADATSASRTVRVVLAMLAGTLAIALSARLQVPMWPVPMTMQTLAVLAVGMAFGARLGLATVALYLAQGAAGLPVFASGGGIAYFAGPTAGFLWSFPLMALSAGWLAERGKTRTVAGAFATGLVGMCIAYFVGAGWLAASVGLPASFAAGVAPFILGDVLKAAIIALAFPAVWRMLAGSK